MALLNDQIRNDVRDMLADVKNPVKLTVFTQSFECDYCNETRELVEEMAELSNQLSVEVHNFETDVAEASDLSIDKVPAIAVTGAKDYGIRMYGIPSGYEFGSFIEAIRLVSRGESELSPASKELVARLKAPVQIQVFITPT